MKKYYLILLVCFISLSLASKAAVAQDAFHTDEAERLFNYFGDAIYQVQVIDIASAKKASIGSGFQFTDDGLIATNYHVVAEAIQRPSQNRVEFVGEGGLTGKLTIVAADVVHDLAILKKDTIQDAGAHLILGNSRLPKGSKIHSLGNPHDIGFTIIEGTYNGLDKSINEKIHFSGALNPGMSGGPAIDHQGNVVGVNVSTAGNSISFLVPVDYLKKLLETYRQDGGKTDFISNAPELLEKQLLDNQDIYMGALINSDWEKVSFGSVNVPGRIASYFKCWGSPGHKETDPFQHHRSTCSSQEKIYLDDEFTTGPVIYRYDAIMGNPDLNLMRFYTLYEENYRLPLDAYRNATEDTVTNFDCRTKFMDVASKKWKASFCVRKYKKYPALHDLHVYMAMVGEGRQGLLISLIAEGISRDNALKFTQKFLGNMESLNTLSTKEGVAP